MSAPISIDSGWSQMWNELKQEYSSSLNMFESGVHDQFNQFQISKQQAEQAKPIADQVNHDLQPGGNGGGNQAVDDILAGYQKYKDTGGREGIDKQTTQQMLDALPSAVQKSSYGKISKDKQDDINNAGLDGSHIRDSDGTGTKGWKNFTQTIDGIFSSLTGGLL